MFSFAQNLPVACGGSLERYRLDHHPNSTYEWSVTGGVVVNDYIDSVDIRWNTVSGGGIITVTETNVYNCIGEPYSQTLIISAPNVDIGFDEAICSGETFTFVAASSSVSSYLWQDGLTSGDRFIASEEGDYWVRVTDAEGCEAVDSAVLVVNDLPIVDLGPDTTLCRAEDILVLDAYNPDIINYEWSLYTDINPISQVFGHSESVSLEITTNTRYIWVSVEDGNGCIGYDTVTVALCGSFIIPNAFTPNGDAYNQEWVIRHLNAFPEVTVDIYNRFGDRVFTSKGYEEPWDGTDMKGKKLPMDAYYYVIDLHNGEEPKVGTVTIIR